MRHPRAAAVAAAAAVAVLTGGCSGRSAPAPPPAGGTGAGGSPSPTRASPVPKLELADCTKQIKPQIAQQPGGDRNLSFSCGRLPVPLDHSAPDGPTL